MGKCMFLRKGETHTKPVAGILASDLAVGSTVKLMEDGTAVEYLVVNQGIPENSSLYDASCDGTWLLRKDVHSSRTLGSANTLGGSALETWLQQDFFNSLGSVEQTIIKQVRIPYYYGFGTSFFGSGTGGLLVKIFLLSGIEVGLANGLQDGEKLSYFETGTDTSALNKRIAYINSIATTWWLRTPVESTDYEMYGIYINGGSTSNRVTSSQGVRPALILPSNALFDETTLILKGAA